MGLMTAVQSRDRPNLAEESKTVALVFVHDGKLRKGGKNYVLRCMLDQWRQSSVSRMSPREYLVICSGIENAGPFARGVSIIFERCCRWHESAGVTVSLARHA